MSRELVTLVYKRRIGSVHRKAILAHCADKASDNGKGIWASKQTIADETECGRSTVIKIMNQFVEEGILIPVGQHKVTNGSTVIYDLNIDAVSALPEVRNDTKKLSNQSTSGTSPDQYQSTSGTSTSPPAGPDPSTSGTQTVLEPSLEPRVPPLSPTEILETVLREETAKDFASHRKAMKKPLTPEAARRLVKRVANHPDPDSVFDESIACGWQGVFPERKTGNGKSNDGAAAELARRAGERFAARAMDRRPGANSSQPLLPARQSSGGSRGGD